MRYIYLFITVTIALASFNSCTNEGAKPKDIIAEEEMVDILAEIELTQAVIKLRTANKDTLAPQPMLFTNGFNTYEEVYSSFNISEDQFNKSLAYYCQHPKTLESIYVEVITRLSQKQAENQ